ncbi:MAG: uroporphyrinogen decarboxylase family protein [Propionibacteriaceae bacterium]|jgi:hypothetical protein|nr:uroporphyrinogen decarboxylase family protein [Propionibacteriaceae bacterium]
MISVQASVSKGWLNHEGGFVFDERYYTDPLHRMEQDLACHEFVKARFPDYPVYNMEDNLVQAEYVAANQLLVGAIQPNMIIAAALGSDFVFAPDKDSDVAGYPLAQIASADELPAPEELLERPVLHELTAQVERARAEHPELRVIPPFFWDTSGRATIHGIVTTSMKFIGPDVFMLMMDSPELVHAIHKWIADVYTVAIGHFSRIGGLPATSIHVGECAGTMLSQDMYAEFVTPYLSQLGREFGALRLHSCGNADHVMDAICAVENLAVIDTGSNTSLAGIRRRMGADFEINTFPPVEALLKDAAESDIAAWLETVLADNAGGPLKLAYHLEADYNQANCVYIHEELARRGIVPLGRRY